MIGLNLVDKEMVLFFTIQPIREVVKLHHKK